MCPGWYSNRVLMRREARLEILKHSDHSLRGRRDGVVSHCASSPGSGRRAPHSTTLHPGSASRNSRP